MGGRGITKIRPLVLPTATIPASTRQNSARLQSSYTLCRTGTKHRSGQYLMNPIGTESHPPITELLYQMRAGDASARGELMSVVHRTLHRIAESQLRKERPDHTLQSTALVNEAYLKLFGHAEIEFADRAHFFAVVSRAMRRILADHARARVGRQSAGLMAVLLRRDLLNFASSAAYPSRGQCGRMKMPSSRLCHSFSAHPDERSGVKCQRNGSTAACASNDESPRHRVSEASAASARLSKHECEHLQSFTEFGLARGTL